jgi:beta-1,4-mannosyltransferase
VSEKTPHVESLTVCCFPLVHKENSVLTSLYAVLRERGFELIPWKWGPDLRKAHIFHVHWPDAVVMGRSKARALVKTGLFLFSSFVFRLRGTRIVQHVHNIGSHDQLHPRLEAFMWSVFLPMVDCFVHLNSASIDEMKRKWPRIASKRHEVVFHPHYEIEGTSHGKMRREDVRKSIGLDSSTRLLLSFGLIRPYKGIEDLISSFVAAAMPETHLLVVGRPYCEEYGARLCAMAKNQDHITLRLEYLPDDELSDLIAAADFVVMAHRKLNNSGVAMLALANGRAICAPALGAIPEISHIVGQDWVHLFDPPLDAADLLSLPNPPDGAPDLSAFHPDSVGLKLAQIMTEVASSPRS